ncbi:hypothetical protein ACFX1Q_017681 [Malus domestica]
MAFLMISGISILSSFLLGTLVLFTKERSTMSLIKLPRDPREAKLLVRLECGVLMAMLVMQVLVLVMSRVLHCCWVREYEGLEAKNEAMTKKMSRWVAKVQEESMENVAKIDNRTLQF